MPYSKFTLSKAKKDFQITIEENVRFLPTVEPVAPSSRLLDDLEEVPWAIAVGSEKARSESIIYPVLQGVRRICDRQVSLFSGSEFNVDAEADLTGYVDFLFSRSPEQLLIEAPVVIVGKQRRQT
ncbi:MAG: hypothetical protein HC866_08620 [Leptolyngbyaceae cyanobacterium RU_5_1]|nr:hypothetical protein [Leptolyngbyaceae cyanobacterium RU_5_1]